MKKKNPPSAFFLTLDWTDPVGTAGGAKREARGGDLEEMTDYACRSELDLFFFIK